MKAYVWIALLLGITIIAQAEVKIADTFPVTGARSVDPKTKRILLRFNAPVRTDGHSFLDYSGEEVNMTSEPVFREGGLVCDLPVALRPGITYDIWINPPFTQGLWSAADPNVPVTPYILTFTTSNKEKAGKSRSQRWHEDLAYLAKELPARHTNLFFKLTKEEFYKEVADLDRQIPKLTDDQIIVGLMKVAASVGDGHTVIANKGNPLLTTVLPMNFYQFKDGIFIVAADEKYRQALRGRVVRIGNMDIQSAGKAISTAVSHENDAWLKGAIPFMLKYPRFLAALGIIPSAKRAEFRVVTTAGKGLCIDVTAVPRANLGNIVAAVDFTKKPPPPAFRKLDSLYWVDYLPTENTVYVQYNTCQDAPGYPVSQLKADTEELLSEHETARLVIDLRYNGGGGSSFLDPLIASLAGMPRFKRRGHLFAIIGRNTFSSAVMNANDLRDKARAILVGEPTGGKPNCYGQIKRFQLSNSGLTVDYSTKFFRITADDTPSLMPDIPAESSFHDFLARHDPAMEAILRHTYSSD